MHPIDILHYGHNFVERTLGAFPVGEVYQPGACGVWSVKDLVAHLGSFEQMLVELLDSLHQPGETPTLDEYRRERLSFNDHQVALRKSKTYAEVLEEYNQAYQQVLSLARRLEPALWQQTGLLDWYGAEYDLEDFIVYTFYGHKREHCGQIQVFSDRFK
jgi:hypothetical protein